MSISTAISCEIRKYSDPKTNFNPQFLLKCFQLSKNQFLKKSAMKTF